MAASKDGPANEKPLWVKLRRACKIADIGETRMRRYIKEGVVESRLVGHTRLISYRSLENLGAE